jgi:predicted RNA-binding Zn ribbon-like protein
MVLGPGSVTLPAEMQPGDRPPAPEGLGLVQAFANTFWDLQRGRPEQFRTPRALARWLQRRGLLRSGAQLDESELQRTLEIREGIRALLFANSGIEPDRATIERLNGGLQSAEMFVQLDDDAAPEFLARHHDLDGALAVIASNVALAQIEGLFARLKACPGPDCGWAFYDHSRNLAGTWCAMSVCGSRVKARQYRQRRRRAVV